MQGFMAIFIEEINGIFTQTEDKHFPLNIHINSNVMYQISI